MRRADHSIHCPVLACQSYLWRHKTEAAPRCFSYLDGIKRIKFATEWSSSVDVGRNFNFVCLGDFTYAESCHWLEFDHVIMMM